MHAPSTFFISTHFGRYFLIEAKLNARARFVAESFLTPVSESHESMDLTKLLIAWISSIRLVDNRIVIHFSVCLHERDLSIRSS